VRALRLLVWHQDSFDLPEGAVLQASSSAYSHQAFRWGEHAYGIQFHAELEPQAAGEWASIPAYRTQLDSALGPDGLSHFVTALERQAETLRSLAHTMLGRWLELVSAARAEAA
jgi:GMP synthase (glutamine-hydrolysing)